MTTENTIKQAETGDMVAESAMKMLEDRISCWLAIVIGLLIPDIILIGGMLDERGRLFTNISRKWPGYIRSSVKDDTRVPLRTSNPCPYHLYFHGAANLCNYA